MLEESIPSILAYLNSWFTQPVLFLLLNLMIGTIAVTSGLGTHQQPNQTQDEKPRSSSVLERLKSINLNRHNSKEENPFTTTLQPLEKETHVTHQTLEKNPEEETLLNQNAYQVQDHDDIRTNSDTKQRDGDFPVKLPQKMRKSASAKLAFRHFEEEDMVESRRPSTAREGKSKASEVDEFGDYNEVDAKADDFINKFKQQLKLQSLDTIMG